MQSCFTPQYAFSRFSATFSLCFVTSLEKIVTLNLFRVLLSNLFAIEMVRHKLNGLHKSFKSLLDSTVDSFDPTESFSERYGFDCSSIDSITQREIEEGTGANIWRDVKSLLELLAGTEERAIEMLKADES